MVYHKLFSKGLKYVNDAGNNWDARKRKLITAWLNSETDYRKRTPKKDRINRVIDVLEERIRTLSKMLYDFKENQERLKEESQRAFVMLECPDFSCRYSADAVGTAVRLKDYEPGKYKCDKCGAELLTEEDRNIDLILFDLGICPP